MFAKRQNVALDDYGMTFVINTGIWLVFIDCLSTWVIDEVCNRKCGIRRSRSRHLHAIIEQVEEMLRMTYHIVIKVLVKFMLIIKPYIMMDMFVDLFENLYNFLYSFRALVSNIWL